MRIELDKEADILYIELKDGEVDNTVDLDDGVFADLDAEGRVLGVEFIALSAFRAFLERHNGSVEIPDVVEDPDALRPIPPGQR